MADFGVCWRLMFSYFHGLVYMSSLSSMLSLDYIKTWYQLPEAAGIYIYIYILVFLFRTMKRVTLLKTGGSAPCNNDAMVKRPEKSFIWRRFRLKLLKTKDGGHIWTKCLGKCSEQTGGTLRNKEKIHGCCDGGKECDWCNSRGDKALGGR